MTWTSYKKLKKSLPRIFQWLGVSVTLELNET